jgi:hypothetical protein
LGGWQDVEFQTNPAIMDFAVTIALCRQQQLSLALVYLKIPAKNLDVSDELRLDAFHENDATTYSGHLPFFAAHRSAPGGRPEKFGRASGA